MCAVVKNGQFERNIEFFISSQPGSAQEEDYVVLHMAHLTLQPHDRRSCIIIETSDDDLVEGAEEFQVTITSSDAAAVITTPSTTTVQITDNDCRSTNPVTKPCMMLFALVDARFGFESSEYSFSEGPGLKSVVVVLLEHELTSPVSVQFTVTDLSACKFVLFCVVK